jgi:8-oxo-dGTP diphosphatase
MTEMSNNIDVAVGILPRLVQGQVLILIAQRPKENILGGYWEFPGGKLEPGEEPAQCVEREFTEELGITVRAGQAMEAIEHTYPHAKVRLLPFICQWVSGQIENIEVDQHRWVKLDALSKYSFPQANTSLIESIQRDLPKMTFA